MAGSTTENDGFREIQLGKKQLFFVVMAASTVLVFSFMLGMLVGRGVRAEREESARVDALTATPPIPLERTPTLTSADTDPREAAPPAPAENDDADLKAGNEEPKVAVRRDQAPASTQAAQAPPAAAESKTAAAPARTAPAASAEVKTAPATPPAKAAPAPVAPPRPAAEPAARPPAPAPTTAANAEGERAGYAVQVAAVTARSEAETIAKRLTGKGYAAYVEVPKGTSSTFRVRVGTFTTRREAQTVADRLKQEEKFKPWVTR